MRIGPREQVLLVIAVVVLVLVALGVFLVGPELRKMSSLDSQISDARAEVAAAQTLLASREQSKSRAADTEAKWLRLANLVPDAPDLPSLIVELQDAAFDSGVQLLGVTPSPPKGAAGYYAVPVQLEIVGTWSDTVDYLQRLTKLTRGVRVVDSSTSRVNDADVQTRENATVPNYSARTVIKIEAYMIPDSPSPTPAPAPAPAGQ